MRMRAHIESSLNPDILMFSCEEGFSAEAVEFTRENVSDRSPLASDLFYFPFIEKVFLTGNLVAVQRNDQTDWGAVGGELRKIVNRHLLDKTIVRNEGKETAFKVTPRKTDDSQTMRFVINKKLGKDDLEIKSKTMLLEKELYKFDYIRALAVLENEIHIQKTEEVEWKFVISDLCWYIADLLEKHS